MKIIECHGSYGSTFREQGKPQEDSASLTLNIKAIGIHHRQLPELIERAVNAHDALIKVLLEEREALTTWRSCLKLPKDLEEGFQISLSKIDDALERWGKDL